MTPIAQLIAELRAEPGHVHRTTTDTALMLRAAEALARQEELLAEAGKVVGPFAEVARPMLRTYPQEAELFAWASPLGGNLMLSDFRAAARLSDKLKGE